MPPDSTQFVRGTLDLLILKTLAREGPLHGYGVAAEIATRTDGALGVEDGALYQSLHRMEARGLVEAAWGHADSGKRAKFYRPTAEGRARLTSQTREWLRYAEAVRKVLMEVESSGPAGPGVAHGVA